MKKKCITHADATGMRYLVDVTTVDVTAASYRLVSSSKPRSWSSSEERKTREYRSKVDGRKTQLIPAAVELNGKWGDGKVSLFKKVVALATREGRNEGVCFARITAANLQIAGNGESVLRRRGMMYQAHYALRKHL